MLIQKPLWEIILLLFSLNKLGFSQHLQSKDSSFIPTCVGYVDARTNGSTHGGNVIVIPATRSRNYPNPLHILIKQRQTLNCASNKAESRGISWHLEDDSVIMPPRNFIDVESGTSEAHQYSYFTSTGYLYDSITRTYYKPNGDYCVKSISDDGINLNLCTIGDDCSNAASPNTWCIPKCCAIDEVLIFWKRQCQKLSETDGVTPWLPHIYESHKNPHKKLPITSKNIHFQMPKLPRNCTFKMSNDAEMFKILVASSVKHPKLDNVTHEEDKVKLTAPSGGKSGTLRPILFFSGPRRWKLTEQVTDFCVDGFFVKFNASAKYTGKAENFMMIYCSEDDESKQDANSVVNSWLYVVVSIIALLFLLATMIVYGALWDKQNLHGLTILSYTASSFGGYLFLTAAHAVFLNPNPEVTGIFKRGPLCYTIAVLSHYFYISNLMWLTVMNFDLWLTFKTIRAARRDSKEWVKFGYYSLFAFGLPLGLIIAFVIVDEYYRDPSTEVAVPDYAKSTCFVSPDFRAEYVYAPMEILLVINFIMIGLTMKIFIEARKQTTKTFSGGAANANRYSAKLFAKLFIVMGGLSIIDNITWYYNNAGSKHWIIAVVEGISYLAPIILFILFCLNARVINQLREKYPNFMHKLEPALRCFEKSDEGHTGSTGGDSCASNKTTNTYSGESERGSESTPLKNMSKNEEAP